MFSSIVFNGMVTYEKFPKIILQEHSLNCLQRIFKTVICHRMNYLEYTRPALFLTNKRNKIANYVPLIYCTMLRVLTRAVYLFYYTTQAVRGPITKINQSKCSIAGPIFSKYWTGHCPEWSRTCVFAFFSRVINLLLTKLARDRTGRASALGLFCTDLAALGPYCQDLGSIFSQYGPRAWLIRYMYRKQYTYIRCMQTAVLACLADSLNHTEDFVTCPAATGRLMQCSICKLFDRPRIRNDLQDHQVTGVASLTVIRK